MRHSWVSQWGRCAYRDGWEAGGWARPLGASKIQAARESPGGAPWGPCFVGAPCSLAPALPHLPLSSPASHDPRFLSDVFVTRRGERLLRTAPCHPGGKPQSEESGESLCGSGWGLAQREAWTVRQRWPVGGGDRDSSNGSHERCLLSAVSGLPHLVLPMTSCVKCHEVCADEESKAQKGEVARPRSQSESRRGPGHVQLQGPAHSHEADWLREQGGRAQGVPPAALCGSRHGASTTSSDVGPRSSAVLHGQRPAQGHTAAEWQSQASVPSRWHSGVLDRSPALGTLQAPGPGASCCLGSGAPRDQ